MAKYLPFEDLYIDGAHETERGWFAVVMCPGIDGNFADVYGEDQDDALESAEELIKFTRLGSNLMSEQKSPTPPNKAINPTPDSGPLEQSSKSE